MMRLNSLRETEFIFSSLQVWTHLQIKISSLSMDFTQGIVGGKKQTKILPSLWSSERSYTGHPIVLVGNLPITTSVERGRPRKHMKETVDRLAEMSSLTWSLTHSLLQGPFRCHLHSTMCLVELQRHFENETVSDLKIIEGYTVKHLGLQCILFLISQSIYLVY